MRCYQIFLLSLLLKEDVLKVFAHTRDVKNNVKETFENKSNKVHSNRGVNNL